MHWLFVLSKSNKEGRLNGRKAYETEDKLSNALQHHRKLICMLDLPQLIGSMQHRAGRALPSCHVVVFSSGNPSGLWWKPICKAGPINLLSIRRFSKSSRRVSSEMSSIDFGVSLGKAMIHNWGTPFCLRNTKYLSRSCCHIHCTQGYKLQYNLYSSDGCYCS